SNYKMEILDVFRDGSDAYEEKNRQVNEAECYRNEQVALSRCNAQSSLQAAAAYNLGRKNRADGDATRFTAREQAFRVAPGPTETRLYLETMEQVLPGKKKLILDQGKGRRHLYMLEDGVTIGPSVAPLMGP